MGMLISFLSKNIFSYVFLTIFVLIFTDLSIIAIINGLPLVNLFFKKNLKTLVSPGYHKQEENLYLEIC